MTFAHKGVNNALLIHFDYYVLSTIYYYYYFEVH